MSDTAPNPETPKHRLDKEYEDPHYHDEDDVASPDDAEPHGGSAKTSPRRKPVYRPRRRFYEE